MGSESIQRSQQTTLLQGARPSPKYRLHLVNSVDLTPNLLTFDWWNVVQAIREEVFVCPDGAHGRS